MQIRGRRGSGSLGGRRSRLGCSGSIHCLTLDGGATPQAPGTGLKPLLLPADLRLSPQQFALVCAANPGAVLELTADGQVIAMTPTGGEISARNNLLNTRLQIWALSEGGWRAFDSSGGFRFPDGSVLSPDAALVRLERWQALTPDQRSGFPPSRVSQGVTRAVARG